MTLEAYRHFNYQILKLGAEFVDSWKFPIRGFIALRADYLFEGKIISFYENDYFVNMLAEKNSKLEGLFEKFKCIRKDN